VTYVCIDQQICELFLLPLQPRLCLCFGCLVHPLGELLGKSFGHILVKFSVLADWGRKELLFGHYPVSGICLDTVSSVI